MLSVCSVPQCDAANARTPHTRTLHTRTPHSRTPRAPTRKNGYASREPPRNNASSPVCAASRAQLSLVLSFCLLPLQQRAAIVREQQQRVARKCVRNDTPTPQRSLFSSTLVSVRRAGPLCSLSWLRCCRYIAALLVLQHCLSPSDGNNSYRRVRSLVLHPCSKLAHVNHL